MNTDSATCRRVSVPVAIGALKPPPGSFGWGEESSDGIRYLYIVIPGSSSSGFDALRCFRGPDRGIEREWSWDGNEEKPTLSPSILNEGEWHGYLRAGNLVSR